MAWPPKGRWRCARGGLLGCVAGEEDQSGLSGGELIRHAENVGAAEIDVEQSHVRFIAIQQRQGRSGGVGGTKDAITGLFEEPLQVHGNQRLVFDDEHTWRFRRHIGHHSFAYAKPPAWLESGKLVISLRPLAS